jgi:anti-anti-sigma factor
MITDRSFDKAAIVHLRGDLRAPSSRVLSHQVQSLLRRGERRILVNLAEVTHLDAAGLGELVAMHNTVAAANGSLRIAGAAGRVRRLLVLTGLCDLLERGSMGVTGVSPPAWPAAPAAQSAA